jgi:prepilin-type N-terminal cleavage/methylation domain-containing protein
VRKQLAALRAIRKDRRRGFTLIELLIVILILGILAAIVMFAVGSFTSSAAVAACNTDAKTAETAVTAYYAENGKWPTSLAQLTLAGSTTDPGGPYLRSVPNSPYYAITTNGQGAILVAVPPTGTAEPYDTDNVCGEISPTSGSPQNQSITIVPANPPSPVTVSSSTYTPTATATSGLTVVLTIDTISASVCSISSGTVSFNAVGTCIIDANQPGNGYWNAAPEVQQSISVTTGPSPGSSQNQSIKFTSANPSPVTAGDSTYTPTATATSGLDVIFSIDNASTSGACSISSGTVSFNAVGTCIVDANQPGNGYWNAAPEAQQSITVGTGSSIKQNQSITFTSKNPSPVTISSSPTYTPTAMASPSDLDVIFSVDSASTPGACSITNRAVTFKKVGTCIIDANQPGNGYWNAAPEVQQVITVGTGLRNGGPIGSTGPTGSGGTTTTTSPAPSPPPGGTWSAAQSIGLSWSVYTYYDLSVSCASSAFCVVVNGSGNALTYNGSSWSGPQFITSNLLGSESFGTNEAVSCPSSTFCVAVDNDGNAYTYNGSSWSSAQLIDPPGSFSMFGPQPPSGSMSSVSCASSTFCVAVDDNGYVLTYNGSSWSNAQDVDATRGSELLSVSCPSSTFCIATDNGGHAITYDGSSWSRSTVDLSYPLGVSCASSNFCVAWIFGLSSTSDNSDVYTYDGSSWSSVHDIDGTGSNWIQAISCASSSFCVAVDDQGNAMVYSGELVPLWSSPQNIDGTTPMDSVSCPTTSFCVATDRSGNVFTFTD